MLLLIVLTFIWYFIVKDVDTERFTPARNRVILKYDGKYLEGHKNQILRLGFNKTYATYLINDYPGYPDGIRIESDKYPKYFITYTKGGKWTLQSHYYIDNPEKSIFVPISIDDDKIKKRRMTLLCQYNNKCINIEDEIVDSKKLTGEEYPTTNQMLTFIPY